MHQPDKKTALITGGSGGIGLALAKLFLSDNYRLVLVASPEDELLRAKAVLREFDPDVEVFLLAKDLTDSRAALDVYEFTVENDLQIDVLVNCAGFGTYGFVDEIDIGREMDMLKLHICTFYYLTRLYLNEMIRRDQGQIINLSSITAFQPNPFMATYGATKSFILQFSRAIRFELKERGSQVQVLAVCPTAVKDTGFQSNACMENTGTFSCWLSTNADTVARDTYNAMKRGQEVVIPGKRFSILHSLVGLLPTCLLMKISRAHLKEKQ